MPEKKAAEELGVTRHRATSLISISQSFISSAKTATKDNGKHTELVEKAVSTSNAGSVKYFEAYWTAMRIYEGTFNTISYKEYANYLGNPDNIEILREFVNILQPLPNSLLLTLETISSRLYFIAEAQNIDRILEEFSKQWIETYQDSEWTNNYAIAHIVLFSLLLLNSDLHNEENTGSQSRFSSKMFVENTIYALKKEVSKSGENSVLGEENIEYQLSHYYESLRYNPLPLFTRQESRMASSATRNRRSSTYSVAALSLTSVPSTFSSTSTVIHESHTTANWKFHHHLPLPVLYLREPFDEEFINENHTYWMMDGIIEIADKQNKRDGNRNKGNTLIIENVQKFRKNPKLLFSWLKKSKKNTLFEESNSVAFLNTKSTWSTAKVRITEGRIFIFKLNSTVNKRLSTMKNLEDFKLLSSAYVVYNLFEAFAELAQDNVIICTGKTPSALVPTVGNFTITIPMGLRGQKVKLEFQTDTVEEAQLYVESINFWAARLTPVPSAQFEIVSNDEYGWSNNIMAQSEDIDAGNIEHNNISDWNPLYLLDLLYNEFDNITDETEFLTRLSELTEFTQDLESLIDNHNAVKPKMVTIWKGSLYFKKVMDNWNRRYLYLNKLHEKTSIYLLALQKTNEIL